MSDLMIGMSLVLSAAMIVAAIMATRGKRSLGISILAAGLVAGLTVFHGQLLGQRIADLTLLEPLVALRWGADGSLWSVSSIAPFKVYRFEAGRWRELEGTVEVSPECRITSFAVLGGGAGTRLAIGTADDGVLVRDGRGNGPSAWRRITRADDGAVRTGVADRSRSPEALL